MFSIGSTVRVLAPFSDLFPDAYKITDIVTDETGQTAYILGDFGGFDAMYLEAA